MTWRALEETTKSDRQLRIHREEVNLSAEAWQVTKKDSAPATCFQFGMHTKRIRRRRIPHHYEMVQRQRWRRECGKDTDIHPVMKQYAASGIVERSGSTSVMRNSRSATRRGFELAVDGEGEDTGAGSPASAAFAVAAWDNGGAEDMFERNTLTGDGGDAVLSGTMQTQLKKRARSDERPTT